MYEHTDYERTIDIVNMAGYLLIKWKAILLCTLITAAIGGVFGLSSTVKSANNAVANDGDMIAQDIASELSEEEKAEAEEYYSQIIASDNAIDRQKRFNEASYIMSLDPETAVGYNIHYLVETDIENISATFSESLLSEEDYMKISDILGTDIGRGSLDDVVKQITETIEVNAGYSGRTEINCPYKSLISLVVIAPDRDTCEKIIGIVENAVSTKAQLLNNNGAVYTCTLVDNGFNPYISEYINRVQQDNINKMGTIITNRDNFLNDTVGKIDEREKSYINELRGVLTDEVQTVSPQKGIPWGYMFRNTLIGLLVGCFLSICCGSLVYIVGGRIRTAEDLSDYFGVSVLKTLSANETYKLRASKDIIIKWGYVLSGMEEVSGSIDILCMELKSLAGRNGNRKVFIAADSNYPGTMEIAHRISEEVSDAITCDIGGFNPNKDEIESYLASDVVLLIPVIDVTKIRDIRGFMELCRRNRKSIIGSVLISDGRK